MIMKTLKLIVIILVFSAVKGFAQNPTIENATICSKTGESIYISVANVSPTDSFIWQLKTPTADWTTINNLNAANVYSDYSMATLYIVKTATLPVNATQYRVVVTNGSSSLTSNTATLTVSPLSVSSTITGASPLCFGGNKTLTYGTDSIGDIQWQFSTTSSTADFYDIDFENKKTYNAVNIQETTWYRVRNTSGACNPSYSPAVQVVVNPFPIAGYIDGGDINVCKSSNTTELILIDYEGKIQWQKSIDIAGPFASIPNATAATYKANSLAVTTYFKAVVTSGDCLSESTDPVVIIVDPTPISKLITGATTVCFGDNIKLTYGSDSIGDIQWQSSTTSSTDDFYDIDNEIGLVFTATNLQESTWFRVMNSSGGCNSVFSPAVKVLVNPLPIAGNIEGGGDTVCKSLNSTVLSLNNQEGTIKWQKAPDVNGSPGTFVDIPSATKETYTAVSLTATTHFRAVLSSSACASEMTDSVVIFVSPTPVAKLITGASPACKGSSKVLVYGEGSLGDIQWQFSTTSASSGFNDIPGEIGHLFLASDLQETTWIRVSNSIDSCNAVYSPVVQITINPPPVSGFIEGGNKNVSKKINATELTLKGYKGTSFQWQKAASLTDNFTDIPFSSSSTYIATGLTDNAYFRVIISSDICTKIASEPVFINVNSDFEITTFPNPFDSEFNVNLTPLTLDPIELKVYDISGRIIENLNINSSEINSKRLGGNYLLGVYLMIIKQGSLEKSSKVIKK
ncbi:T9SS type A sorting domain-containing protein [Flavobacterium franklandianum]|nr:T9SS type A sorting domain-containing protein [Flavobacterium franklandianum]